MGLPVIEAKNLFAGYRGNEDWTLKGIDLTVNAGEFVVIVGPNNAGKTTFCRALTGLVPHSYPAQLQGELLVGGADITAQKVSRLAREWVRYVFDNPESQFVGMSVEEEVSFALETTGLSRAEMQERVRWALEATAMWEMRHKSPEELSGGQKQRVAIASALATRPRILVLDEPTAELDPIGKAEVYRVVESLARESGLTIIMVDHHIEQVARYAHRVVLIADGRVVREGAPREFFRSEEPLRLHGVDLPEVIRLHHLRGDDASTLPLTLDEAAAQLCDGRFTPATAPAAEPPAPAEPLLQLQALTFAYPDGTAALKGIDLTVRRGEFLAILGANGSGKSTLARHLNGLLKPTSGRVMLGGADLAAVDPQELVRRVGYVFQNPDHQICMLTVADELAFGPRMMGFPPERVKETVASLIERFDLAAVADKPPHFLSKANRQRLAIAGVLAVDPEILVVDEPTTGFDARESHAVMALLTELNRAGKTIIVITHEIELIARYAPRTAVVAGGRILADGPTRAVLARESMLAESAIAAPAMTRLARRLSGGGELVQAVVTAEELLAAYA